MKILGVSAAIIAAFMSFSSVSHADELIWGNDNWIYNYNSKDKTCSLFYANKNQYIEYNVASSSDDKLALLTIEATHISNAPGISNVISGNDTRFRVDFGNILSAADSTGVTVKDGLQGKTYGITFSDLPPYHLLYALSHMSVMKIGFGSTLETITIVPIPENIAGKLSGACIAKTSKTN